MAGSGHALRAAIFVSSLAVIDFKKSDWLSLRYSMYCGLTLPGMTVRIALKIVGGHIQKPTVLLN
jgi:hypothetical protein